MYVKDYLFLRRSRQNSLFDENKNKKKIFFALYIPQHNTESIAKSYSMFVGRSRLSKSLGGKTDIALFQNELFVLVPITADL